MTTGGKRFFSAFFAGYLGRELLGFTSFTPTYGGCRACLRGEWAGRVQPLRVNSNLGKFVLLNIAMISRYARSFLEPISKFPHCSIASLSSGEGFKTVNSGMN